MYHQLLNVTILVILPEIERSDNEELRTSNKI